MICRHDKEHLSAMRKLGVVWKRGLLPVYPGSMVDSEKSEADIHYDAMSEDFVNHMLREY